jgi:hypothetical protein
MADNSPTAHQTSALQDSAHTLLLQQWLADLDRQGRPGMLPLFEMFRPQGRQAAHEPIPGSTAPPLPSQAPSPAPSARTQLEGRLFEATTVTAYQMSARESYDWVRGNDPSRQVTATIAEGLKEVASGKAVPVLLEDGRTAYTHGTNPVQILAKEIELWHPLQRMSAQLSQLQDRLSTLSQGFQVQMSVQVGTPRDAMQDTLTTLEQRVDQLTSRLDSLTATGHTARDTEAGEPPGTPATSWWERYTAGRDTHGNGFRLTLEDSPQNGHALPAQLQALQGRLTALQTPTAAQQREQGRGW